MPLTGVETGSKNGVKKGKKLLRNKRVLLIGLAVLVVAGIGIVLILNRAATKPSTPGSGNPTDISGDEAEMLPQSKRDNGQTQNFEVFSRDPFASPLKLTGIVTGGTGGSMAIVESSGTTYVVSVGDVIDDFWTVLKITHEMVLLTAGDRDVSLRLHHRVVEEQNRRDEEEEDAQ